MLHIDGQRRADGEYDSNGGRRSRHLLDAEHRSVSSNRRTGLREPNQRPTAIGETSALRLWRTTTSRDATIVLSPRSLGSRRLLPRRAASGQPPQGDAAHHRRRRPERPEAGAVDRGRDGDGRRHGAVRRAPGHRQRTGRDGPPTGRATARRSRGSDYEAINETLEIPAGQRSASIDVRTTQDTVYEGDETFTVTAEPNPSARRFATAPGRERSPTTTPHRRCRSQMRQWTRATRPRSR